MVENPAPATHTLGEPKGRELFLLSLAAMGVVFGDIGTSPLYSVRECFFGPHAVHVNQVNILGVLSLIVWVLIIIISIEYLVFILRADNRGQGGILALAALLTPVKASSGKRTTVIAAVGLFGAALLYADGMITPAITVLSAVEGIEVVTAEQKGQTVEAAEGLSAMAAEGSADESRFVQAITIAILVGLFLFQSRGTLSVGKVFGPVILVWFLVIGLIGLWQVLQAPGVLWALNPFYAAEFFWHNGWHGFLILGSVFLVITGGEALYADIGHFGIKPIRLAWFAIAMPGLLLNYFGQGAFLLTHARGVENPFFQMAPRWMLWPLVGLATAAAVIASQAIITGAYSLTLQAIQLGYSPRQTIRHTSAQQRGQIYIPSINWSLMAACILLVLGFGSSSALAAAYGVAISVTMLMTTALFYVLARYHWKWHPLVALLVAGTFISIDLNFFVANMMKIGQGGWFPLVVAGIVFLLMSTWQQGRARLGKRLRERQIPLELYLAELLSKPPIRVPGTAVFMSGNPIGTPLALRHNVMHNKVLHETVVIVSVETAETPHVSEKNRVSVEEIGIGFWRIIISYGFMEEPDVPKALASVCHPQLRFDHQVSYFLGRETLLATSRTGMAMWRDRLFTWMSHTAQSATLFYKLPTERVVEVGVQVEL